MDKELYVVIGYDDKVPANPTVIGVFYTVQDAESCADFHEAEFDNILVSNAWLHDRRVN